MKKRLISLALTLALCLGLAIPVMAAGSYGPYTITGTSYGRAFTVTFSAAKTERRTIQIREHGDIGNTYSAYQKKDGYICDNKAGYQSYGFVRR